MNKKIKIIDLINMQYKKEKMPKNIRIKYSLIFDYYTYNEEIKWYETSDKTSILDVFQKLDYEVEILEDNTKEIEEIGEFVDLIGMNENEEVLFKMIRCCTHKIDEIIKAINSIRKEKTNEL